MNLQKIKEKYKEILEQPEPESLESDEQWEMAYSRMKNKRRKHILTESQCVNRSSSLSAKTINDQNGILRIKQKLAQTLANLNKKNSQIDQLKLQEVKSKQHIKLLQEQIIDLKQSLTSSEKTIIDQKVAYGCLERNIQDNLKSIQSEKMDKQLLQRQIQYYQIQIQNLKRENSQKDIKIDQLKKQTKNVQKYKNLSNRLKQDIARLKELLTETEKYKVFASKIQHKHYIGKGCKEHQCWISDDLVADIELFVKKQQIGAGNKQFISHLAKFISKHVQHAKHAAQKKARKQYNSKLKDNERKINHSMNFMEIRQQGLKKSQFNNSLLKSRRKTLNQSKQCTQSFVYDKLQKSLVAHSIVRSRQQCIELLSTFRRGILDLLQRQINKKKLMKLVDWIIDGVMAIYPLQKAGHQNSDFRLETQQIKISL